MTGSSAPAPTSGYVALLRNHRDYRNLWLAEVISFAGDWFNTIALYTAVGKLSSSTEAIAAVFVSKMLPITLVTPIAGPLVDRFDRKHIMIASDVARFLCALGLIAAYRAGSVWAVLAVVVVMVAFSGVFMPARQAVLPQIVREEDLGAANALSGATWSAMLALGAALGGLVTALIGVELALAVDAATFLLSIVFLARLPSLRPDASNSDDDEPDSTDRSFMAGLRYLRNHAHLAAVICIKPFMALAGGGVALLPVFGTRVFEGVNGPGYIGALYTTRGIGALMGSLLLRRIFGDTRTAMRRLIAPLFGLMALSYVALSYAPSLGWAALAYLFATVGAAGLWVFSGTLAQLDSDNRFRGRIFSIEIGGHTLLLSVTAAGAGSLVDRMGWAPQQVTLLSAALIALPLGLWLAVLALTRSDT